MTVGIRHDDLRRRNRAMVIAAVRRAGQPSRTEIAGTTALSHSTISAISSDLIGEGVLSQAKGGEAGPLKRGRPQVAISLNPDAASVIAVVLSLNSLSAALIDYSGRAIAERSLRLPTLTLPRDELIAATRNIVVQLIEDHGADAGPVMRIVLAIQGITESGSRALLWSPITPETDIPFAQMLEQATGIPVTVENDCNMIALALRSHDPERYRNDFIAILLSHGIGMGMVLRGELFTGTQSSGGEFGHMIHRPGGALCRCGRRGCIEAYAGNYAIWRNAQGMPEDSPPVADISDADIAALADRARRHRRSRTRRLPQGRRGARLRTRQPVRADRPGPGGDGRARRAGLRPARACRPPGDRHDRRRPAQQGHFVRHGAQRNAADPRRLRRAGADLPRPAGLCAGHQRHEFRRRQERRLTSR